MCDRMRLQAAMCSRAWERRDEGRISIPRIPEPRVVPHHIESPAPASGHGSEALSLWPLCCGIWLSTLSWLGLVSTTILAALYAQAGSAWRCPCGQQEDLTHQLHCVPSLPPSESFSSHFISLRAWEEDVAPRVFPVPLGAQMLSQGT